MLLQDRDKLPRKRLEEIRGFLNYAAQTYDLIATYLIGFHITIDGWRENRDEDGWRLGALLASRRSVDEVGGTLPAGSETPPSFVKAKPRLESDIMALLKLTFDKHPPLKRKRSGQVAEVFYGFGDASGSGFGATFQIKDTITY